ncbi:IS1595 family transposase [Chitinophagaceae bacterium LWZ2-11]
MKSSTKKSTQIEYIARFTSFHSMLKALPDDQACREYLEEMRWKGIPTCTSCGSINKDHYKLKVKGEFKGMYKCKDCKQRFTVTLKTMFEGSHIPLRKWFIGMYVFSAHKKGISSHQLGRDLEMTQTSAWFMLNRIRNTYYKDQNIPIDGAFSVDESYIGGKSKNKHLSKRIGNTQGRSLKDKVPVFGIKQVGGDVRTVVVPDTKAKTLKPIIKAMIKQDSIVITDEWVSYNGLSKNYKHVVVNHQGNEYVRGGFDTNGIENFWGVLKRGLYGIYHHVSKDHLHRYLTEFEFRYNSRQLKDYERFNLSLCNVERKLTYKELIQEGAKRKQKRGKTK